MSPSTDRELEELLGFAAAHDGTEAPVAPPPAIREEIDLTQPPTPEEAKKTVHQLAIEELARILEDYPEACQSLIKFHLKYAPSLGHRRLGRMYTRSARPSRRL